MRVLGLDYGDKTIGVAVSDPFGWTAQGLEVIRRGENDPIDKSIARLGELIDYYGVTGIVLGYPKNMNNTEGPRCEKTLLFKAELEANFKGIKITLQDERLSTKGSERSMLSGNLSRKKRGEIIDKIAAVFILQGYLDSRKNKKTRCKIYMKSDELNEMDDFEEEFETLIMTDENGNDTEFAIIDAIEYNSNTYYLVAEVEHLNDDDLDAALLKEVSSEGDEAIYEFVEDDDELQSVYALLRDNDDYEIEL